MRTVGRWAGLMAVGMAVVVGVAAAAAEARADGLDFLGAPTVEEVTLAGQSHGDDLPVCDTVCGFGHDSCGWPTDACGRRLGRVDVTLEGAWSFLDGPKGLLGEDSGVANQIRWDSLSYDGAIGGRGALSVRLSGFDRLRVKGWWLGEWDDEGTQTGVYAFSPPPTVTGDAEAVLTSEADLWSGSLQWVRELACCGRYRIDGILGARVASFHETSTASIRSLVVPPGPTGIVRSEAENMFYGGEIGASLAVALAPQWTVSVGGVFLLGLVSKDVTVDDSGLFTPGAKTASESEEVLGWGTELEASLTWHVAPRVGLTLGYQFLYLGEITNGPAGMDFSRADTGQVQAGTPSGHATVHTVFAGLTINL